jgi:hypothetical protein
MSWKSLSWKTAEERTSRNCVVAWPSWAGEATMERSSVRLALSLNEEHHHWPSLGSRCLLQATLARRHCCALSERQRRQPS